MKYMIVVFLESIIALGKRMASVRFGIGLSCGIYIKPCFNLNCIYIFDLEVYKYVVKN